VVPLKDIARVSQERDLIRTTLYLVSPALAAPGEPRSKLYSAGHNHLFRGGID
jgi:precorrin-4/cobalt-precorrin-4 C11-methyltransferase